MRSLKLLLLTGRLFRLQLRPVCTTGPWGKSSRTVFYTTALLVIFIFSFFSLRADSGLNWANQIVELKLSNGMKFLIYPRGESPIFSAYIRFKVGGIDEEAGKTGLAHFLEHMAFKGTESLGTTNYEKEKPLLDQIEKAGEVLASLQKKTHPTSLDKDHILKLKTELKQLHQEEEKYLVKEALAKVMMENGGEDLNATTSKDMTSYFVNLPSDKIRFWAEIESERIFKPVFREFYEERDVVLEERRMRVDNNPDGRLYEKFLETAFTTSPYHWPTIGSAEDVETLTRKDLEEFWRRTYDPENAVGAIVGKVDVKEVEKVLQETFGKITFLKSSILKPAYPEEPLQTSERKIILKMVAQPRFLMGYHKPTIPSDEDYIFDLLDNILAGGRSSRLYRLLVLDKKVASYVDTENGTPGARLPNLFVIEVQLLPGHSTEEVITLIQEEIKKIQREGVMDSELEKAKNQLSVDLLRRLTTNEGLAAELSHFEITAGTWRYLSTYVEKLQRFDSKDIQRVTRKYLVPANRTLAELKP